MDINLIGGYIIELIIVNIRSTDETVAVVEKYIKDHPDVVIRLLNHPKNMGKEAALHRGIKETTGDYIIIQVAYLEYYLQKYKLLLRPEVNGFADVVYGSRFIGGTPHRILFFWHSIGNKFLTAVSNIFTILNLTDMETCYKLFNVDIIISLKLKENRFGFEP